MHTLAQELQTLFPQLTAWRRDFHHYAESGWVEFRTAAKVAEILEQLGYDLAMGRDVVDADSRMGLPDEATLLRPLPAPDSKARRKNGSAPLRAGLPGLSLR
ncbi:Indole-3-acetyl-aspartic acid hydrolase [Leclercia adecarboxylata]|uniref:Indole-3-acetyl-aspartic acid hydrolase n=1 Tax=Leclercia adecarboxylata TaxID=83655 RepID=A0A4U9HY21_9ENTR|nr:Indole-3-acetyl-aspartic acid hydrolase [Leclercia adecarboxylata]